MKQLLKHFIVLFGVLFSFFETLQAQTIRLYTSETGLPNSQINEIYQDSRGFIWVATENGLAWFDGMTFSTFRYERDKPGVLASNLVVTLLEDSAGTCWVGTSRGIQIFNPETKQFRKADLQDPAAPGSNQYISSILEVPTGTGTSEIWIGTSQHGVYILDTQTHQLLTPRRDRLLDLSESPFVYRMFQDSRGYVWMCSEVGGLWAVEPKTLRTLPLSAPEGIVVTAFAEDPQSGQILIGTFNQGILVYDPVSGAIRSSADPAARSCKTMSLLRNRSNARAGEHTFLVGTEEDGLLVYDLDADCLREPDFLDLSVDMSGWKVHSLLEDNQGNVWVGAFQTGVLVLPRSMYGFEHFGGGCVSSVVFGPDEVLWLGMDGGGVVWVTKDRKWGRLDAGNSSLSNDSVMALCFDGHGTLWVGTYLDGLFSYTPQTGFRRFADGEKIGSARVSSLCYDADADVLYVGTYGGGLSLVSASTQQVLETVAEDSNKWVSALYRDRSGMVWIGTFNGPFCYNRKQGKLIPYNVSDPALQSRVYCFQEGADGRMWIGTGEGLVCYDRVKGTTRLYTESDGLSNNVVAAVLQADDQTLWVSTSYGLCRLDPESGVFTHYYAYDGLQDNEFHYGAACRDADGRLIFGGVSGVTLFFPQVVNRPVHPLPPLYFSRLVVDNEEVDYRADSEDNILDKHITEATSITLPHRQNSFSLEFAVLEYTNPRKIRYAYRLDRYDASWRYGSPSSRVATYTHLPSGRYTLQVKAFFDGNEADCSTNSIRIHILPPWYLSAWAFLVYGLLLLGTLAFASLLVGRHRRQVQQAEESEIKDLKLKMFTNISHEIRTPLTLLMSPLKQMRESEQDPRTKNLYNLMYRNSLRILRLVNQVMDMRKVDEGQMQLHFLETDIVYFIKDIMQSFDNMAVTRNIRLDIRSDREVENLWIDQGNFDKIIFNLLSNAFKHTPDGGSIVITVSAPQKNTGELSDNVASMVRISVENSGSHIEDENLDRVFERFFQSSVLDAKMGSGVGLNLTKMLVELHHGAIYAGNTEGGVDFFLYIPVGCAHLTAEEMSQTSHHKDLYTKMPASDELTRSTEDLAFTPGADMSGKVLKSLRNVAIVDDDSEIRDYLLMELKPLYNVKTFSNAQDAWADISTTHPDVVVTDLRMEGMDGLELCDKVKHNPLTSYIPVIVLTSSADEASQIRSLHSGADTFLSKPISIDILKGTIANALSSHDTIRNKYVSEGKYDYGDVTVSSSANQLVDKVVEAVKKNLDNPDFGVEELSREVGLSRVHMNRKLKEMMGISPSTLIRSTRMKQAAYLLVHEKVNISEVAYRVGFSTPSYFSSSFREYFGMTPKDFVARYINVTDPEILNKLFQ